MSNCRAEDQDRLLAWELVNQALFEAGAPMEPERLMEKCGMPRSTVYDIIRSTSRKAKQWQKTITTN